jgi:hypothetical protein
MRWLYKFLIIIYIKKITLHISVDNQALTHYEQPIFYSHKLFLSFSSLLSSPFFPIKLLSQRVLSNTYKYNNLFTIIVLVNCLNIIKKTYSFYKFSGQIYTQSSNRLNKKTYEKNHLLVMLFKFFNFSIGAIQQSVC